MGFVCSLFSVFLRSYMECYICIWHGVILLYDKLLHSYIHTQLPYGNSVSFLLLHLGQQNFHEAMLADFFPVWLFLHLISAVI